MNNKAIGWIAVAVLVVIAFIIASQVPMNQDENIEQVPVINTEQNSTSSAAGTVQTLRDPNFYGVWRSDVDGKFTREFREDGTVTDKYEGQADATVTGTWSVIDPNTEVIGTVPAGALNGMTVVKITDTTGSIYFALNDLQADQMTVTDLSGIGKVSTFTKVK